MFSGRIDDRPLRCVAPFNLKDKWTIRSNRFSKGATRLVRARQWRHSPGLHRCRWLHGL